MQGLYYFDGLTVPIALGDEISHWEGAIQTAKAKADTATLHCDGFTIVIADLVRRWEREGGQWREVNAIDPKRPLAGSL